ERAEDPYTKHAQPLGIDNRMNAKPSSLAELTKAWLGLLQVDQVDGAVPGVNRQQVAAAVELTLDVLAAQPPTNRHRHVKRDVTVPPVWSSTTAARVSGRCRVTLPSPVCKIQLCETREPGRTVASTRPSPVLMSRLSKRRPWP